MSNVIFFFFNKAVELVLEGLISTGPTPFSLEVKKFFTRAEREVLKVLHKVMF